MLIDESGPEYQKLFGNVDPWGQFTSLQPSAEVVQAQLADPSIDPNIQPTDEIDLDLNAYQAVTDLKTGTGRMVQKIALPGNVEGTFGFLASSTAALENILQYESVPGFMNPTEVYQALGQATKGVNPEKAIQAVAFTVGMSALSAMGPVGAAAAAIVGFVVAIGRAFTNRAKLAELNEEQRLIEAYKQFPPLMEPSAEVDTHTVNNSILPVLQTGDWTNLFSPRFSSSQWKAIQRNGGYAVAPGESVEGQNAFGEANEVFNPTAGVGYLPGRNRITSVLQINLDPLSNRVKQWVNGATSSNYILDQTRVIDVGDYLLNSTKFCAIAWAWATTKKRSPHLYKIDVQKLHDRWKLYCDSGINTLRELDPDKRSLDSLYKAAIGCAVGTWECLIKDGKYKQSKAHIHAQEMWRPGPIVFNPNRDPNQGCVMTPYEARFRTGGDYCLSTVYDTETSRILESISERQRYNLRHTLLCAYVRKSWGAFKNDPQLMDLLDEMRTALLEHPDRKLVNLRDVPPEETLPNGDNLRAALIKRGVGKKEFGRLASSPGWIVKPTDPAPEVPGSDTPMPWDLSGLTPIRGSTPTTPTEPTTAINLRIVAGTLAVATTAGALWWARRR
ncbi:MAG: hypothetical protein ACPG4T_16470, partial [Nannocystaceae bacterium]